MLHLRPFELIHPLFHLPVPPTSAEMSHEMASDAIFGTQNITTIILALVLASHHVWMHGDKCPSAVSSPPETAWKSDLRKPVRILLSSYLVLSHSKQWRSRICGHRAQNLLVLGSPQLPFTFGPNVHASLTGDPIPRKSDPGWIRYAS